MCFYTDYHHYSWIAEESADERVTAPTPHRCCECDGVIHAGEVARRYYLQQYSCCRKCEYVPDDEDARELEPPCVGGHDYGESQESWTCPDCLTLLDAIKAVELAAGCDSHESQPRLGRLFDDVEAGDGWDHYAAGFQRLGLTTALMRTPAPDPEDVFCGLAFYRGGYYHDNRPGEYPGAVCQASEDDWDEEEEVDRGNGLSWFDLGGEA